MKLGDIAEITFGFAFKSAEYTSDSDAIRLLRGDNISPGSLRWEGARYFPIDRFGEVSKFALNVGDVVIAMDRPWIEAGLKWSVVRASDVPSLLVQRVARLRAKGELDQGFLGVLIGCKSFEQYVLGIQTGSAVPHISGGQIAAFEFDLPPLPEQHAIAATLGALDDKIESNRRAINVAASLLGALSLKYAQGLERVPLGTQARLLKQSISQSSFANEVVAHYSLPAFDVNELPETVAGSTILSSKLKLSEPGVLVSRLNPRTNRTWYFEGAGVHLAVASTEFAYLVPTDDSSIASLWLALCDEGFRTEIANRVTGTSGSHQRIRPQDMLSVEVPRFSELDPSLLGTVQTTLDFALHHKTENQRLAELRDALLPELLSGRFSTANMQTHV